jgi:hypothetical protein
MEVAEVAGVLGRRPDFVTQYSAGLDRAAGHGKPLVSSDPADPLVADLRKLVDSILVNVPVALDVMDAPA